jgi:hypothetical protein
MTKKVKLSEFGRASHVTARGLSGVLRYIQEHGMPDALSRTSVARHRQGDVYVETEYGPLVQPLQLSMNDGTEKTVWMQHPMALLARMLTFDCELTTLLLTMSVLEIVMYSDEVHPGDAIKGNDRKCQCVYWSIVNLGTSRLSSDAYWFCICSLRSSICRKVKGGMSQIYKQS